jgi:hypothetical protein
LKGDIIDENKDRSKALLLQLRGKFFAQVSCKTRGSLWGISAKYQSSQNKRQYGTAFLWAKVASRRETRFPTGASLSFEQKVFHDIDFSIMGLNGIEYLAYQQNIALEFEKVPKLIFRMKRKGFLKRLLERGVFLTQSFQNRYEVQARENIQSELAHWTYRWLPAL